LFSWRWVFNDLKMVLFTYLTPQRKKGYKIHKKNLQNAGS